MSRARDLLVAGLALALGRGRRREGPERPPLLPKGPSNALAELVAVALLGLATLGAGGFVAAYVVGADTQWMGLAIGLTFAFLGTAAVLAGKVLLPHEESVEERGELEHPNAEAEVAQMIEEADDKLTRGRMLKIAAGGAGLAVGGSLLVPAASLGPVFGIARLERSAWARNRRLVDEAGNPILAEDVDEGAFLTAFPEGAPKDTIGSPLIVIRLPLEMLELSAERQSWAPEGIMAFSKICPHAGCAISIFRYPLFEPQSPGAALVCPCHYSTFDVTRGGVLVFGPAGRDLPQLPLAIAPDRTLRARSAFPDNLGPSWWGVRSKGDRR